LEKRGEEEEEKDKKLITRIVLTGFLLVSWFRIEAFL